MRSFLHLFALTAGLVVATGATAQTTAPPTTPPTTTAPAAPAKPSIATWSFVYKDLIDLADGEKMVLKHGTKFEIETTLKTIVDDSGTPMPQQTFTVGSALAKDLIVTGPAKINAGSINVAKGSEFPARIVLPPEKKEPKMDTIGGVAIPSNQLPDGAAVKAELLSLKEKACPNAKAEIQALRTEVAELKKLSQERWEVTITYKDAENFVKKPELEAVAKKLREERAKIVEVELPKNLGVRPAGPPVWYNSLQYFWSEERSNYVAYCPKHG